ncbi:MAG: hypothetical protein J5697_03960 [Clostridia bacterium]|nr:hypothetical protein [Clostridia bacterium]
MESLYGFREKDVKALAEFLKNRKSEPLTEVFRSYALSAGKEAGTVRNLYYAMAKKSAESEEFRKKYLGGKRMRVNEIKNFSREETADIMKKILLKRNEGKSVRKAVGELSKGNMKLALRYQNKYRSALSDGELLSELKSQGFDFGQNAQPRRRGKRGANTNGLYSEAIAILKKENAGLKRELSKVKSENERLLYRLISKEKKDENL